MGKLSRSGLPLTVAVISAASFALSGATAAAIVSSGWTSGAAVFARLTISALILLIPAIVIGIKQWDIVTKNFTTIIAFGLIGMAAMQFLYFTAVSRLDVSVALLIQHMAPLVIVLWTWFRTRRPPRPLIIVGAVLTVIGLSLVIGVVETLQGNGLDLDPVGVAAAVAAALCMALYFGVAAKDTGGLHPVVMTGGGMLVGATTIGLLILVGVLPFEWGTNDVAFPSLWGVVELPFWVPLGVLALVAGVLAYVTGIYSARPLGATVASFVSLTEVLFAVLWAWLFVSQSMNLSQLIGGIIILGGIVLIKWGDGREARKMERALTTT